MCRLYRLRVPGSSVAPAQAPATAPAPTLAPTPTLMPAPAPAPASAPSPTRMKPEQSQDTPKRLHRLRRQRNRGSVPIRPGGHRNLHSACSATPKHSCSHHLLAASLARATKRIVTAMNFPCLCLASKRAQWRPSRCTYSACISQSPSHHVSSRTGATALRFKRVTVVFRVRGIWSETSAQTRQRSMR